MAFKSQATFTEVSIEQLSAPQQKAWKAFLEAKDAFKTSLQSSAPKGHRVLFSEKYSRLKVAIVPDSASGNGTAKAPSLIDFLAQKAAEGHNA